MKQSGGPLFVMAGLLGLCTLLVFFSSRVASSHASVTQTGTPPQAASKANYSMDANPPLIAPLSTQVIAAAWQDRSDLGLSMPNLGGPSGNVESPDPALVDAAAIASPPRSSVQASDSALASPGADATSGGLGVSLLALLAVLLGVVGGTWGAVYLLRPKGD